ncbi:MAG: hypothetical protein MR922_14555 [Lachnospiraceae bacterium]|nr:hypothetical protein [Lachnospiraceae bacterium]
MVFIGKGNGVMIIQDVDSYSGYMLLYGANENVGGYQIQGTVQKLFNGTVIYDMKYTFNDIMDHEFKYISDQVNYGGLKALQFLNSSITMKDYNFSVSWKDRTILYSDGREDEGWLKDMEIVNFDEIFLNIDDGIRASDNIRWSGYDKDGLLLTKEIYTTMQNYMKGPPEYYGCE